MAELERLEEILQARFEQHLDALGGGVPCHKVEFSRRITGSWALIYYSRRLVRLSPYIFLLAADELKHGSHWRELDATLRHEAAHAMAFHLARETGHSPLFHRLLDRLGVEGNGCADLGPENAAYRYHYRCPSCAQEWRRRLPLRGNWSCGGCAPGGYSPAHRMVLAQQTHPWARLAERRECVARATSEAEGALARRVVPLAMIR